MPEFADRIAKGSRRGRFLGPPILSDFVTLDFTPAALDRDGICAAQQLAAAGYLTLNGALVDSQGRGKLFSSSRNFGRALGVYSAADLSALTFTPVGVDVFGNAMAEDIAGPNNTTTAGKKAFAWVYRVYVNGAVGSNVEVGTIDVFGLPMRLTDRSQVIRCGYNNTLAENAATIVVGDTTDPATATTGDVRGTVAPNGAAGSKRLTVVMVCDMTDKASQFGVSQYRSVR